MSRGRLSVGGARSPLGPPSGCPPKGRPKGSVRDRADWAAIVSVYRAFSSNSSSLRRIPLQAARRAPPPPKRKGAPAEALALARQAAQRRRADAAPQRTEPPRCLPCIPPEQLELLRASPRRPTPFVLPRFTSDAYKIICSDLPADERDAESESISESLLAGSGLQLSCVALADKLGIDRKKLTKKRMILSASCVVSSLLNSSAVEMALAKAQA